MLSLLEVRKTFNTFIEVCISCDCMCVCLCRCEESTHLVEVISHEWLPAVMSWGMVVPVLVSVLPLFDILPCVWLCPPLSYSFFFSPSQHVKISICSILL